MKVITAVDIMGGSVVRLVKGDPASKIEYSKSPVEVAKKWESSGSDMLHVVDLDATLQTGNNNLAAIIEIIKAAKIPVQVAGGIRSAEAADEMFDKGASRVVLGTLAYSDPDSARKLAKKYEKKIVISIDQANGKVMVKGWKESSGMDVTGAMAKFLPMGIDEFLLTSIERDGTLQGPDTGTLAQAAASGARIIASGGISSLEDAIRVKSVGCSSVILGKALYDGRVSIEKVKAIA